MVPPASLAATVWQKREYQDVHCYSATGSMTGVGDLQIRYEERLSRLQLDDLVPGLPYP